jgi:hypothetical protein
VYARKGGCWCIMPWAYALYEGLCFRAGIIVLRSRSPVNAPIKDYQSFFKSLKVVSALEKRSFG